ncbi:MAG: hypothetical protein DI566_11640 [Microbacterium sp.]|nr:MAG: hypothetical protein DI566_11640 [Microbacterium sp.]
MILPETLDDVIGAESDAGAHATASDADAAAARTRADYGRVSRWALGLAGTAGALLAVSIAGFAVSVFTSVTDPLGDLVFGSVVLLIAAAFGVPSVWLLVSLHRSGRRLARAVGYWAGLPSRQGWRQPTRGDWFAVRFLGFSADLFLRLITSALAGLATVSSASLTVRAIVTGAPAWEVTLWAGWTLVLGAVCGGQFGGVQRIQNGHLPRDPARLV